MRHIKYKYNTKKVGFSGTLDPFATGALIVATGQYTKLFQYLNKVPKTYKATLWLGASSSTLDIEKVESIIDTEPLGVEVIEKALQNLQGELSYYPPKFSAKRINGFRAYDLARAGEEVKLNTITSTIYETQLLNYTHPFIHFQATVSEGTYIRSLGAIIAEDLGVVGTLSSLHRVHEGAFYYDNEKAINPFTHLAIPSNIYTGDESYVQLGKKLSVEYFQTKEDGVYLIELSQIFSIIEIKEGEVTYRFNRIPKFKG